MKAGDDAKWEGEQKLQSTRKRTGSYGMQYCEVIF